MIQSLYLHHFRNYSEAEFAFSPGVNWLVGKNGEGKTNVVEALFLLSTGRSFRTSRLSQLIQQGEPFFFAQAYFEREGISQSIKLSFDGEAKRVEYNGKNFAHFTPIIGLLPHILYAPEDIGIIAGPPSIRRRLLNLHIAQEDPLYIHHLARYHRAMAQRNHHLKANTETGIDPWEQVMGESGYYLMQKRKELVKKLIKPLTENISWLSSEMDQVSLSYHPSLTCTSPEEFTAELHKNRKREMRFKATLSGPHRDELLFSLKGLSAKAYASEGQKHSIVAALRLAQLEELRETVPLLSIDDFGAHLDSKRREKLVEKLASLPQVFLTSPELMPGLFERQTVLEVDRYKCLK